MVNRIPPSLNWLINKRARLAGDIQRTNKALSKVQHLVRKLRELEAALEAVDRSLQLHEIQVDVENIKPINSHQTPKLEFPRGDINQLVLTHLKDQESNTPISTIEVANYLYSKHLEIDAVKINRRQFLIRIRQSLNRLRRLGYVIRCHKATLNKVAFWRAAENTSSLN
jgi:hypothetical protein